MLQNNNIDNEFISKIIKEQPLGDAFSAKKTEEDKTDDIQKVRYQGGEEVKDSNGETITEEKRSIIPPFKKEVPLKRKYGEPENSQELSQDIHKYMDMGLSFNDAWDWELKQYPGTAKNINEYYKARENDEVDNDKEYPYTNDVINYDEKGKGWKSKLSPKESVEVESLNKLGIDSLLRGDDYYNATFKLPDEKRSLPATKLYQYLVNNKKLGEWKDLMSNPSGSFTTFKNSLIDEIKNNEEFRAQEKDDIITLLNETGNGYNKWLTELNKQAEKAKQQEEAKKAKAAKTPKPETLGSFTTPDGKTTDVKYPPVATLTDKNGNEIVIDSKQYQENREKDAINEANKQAEKADTKQAETQPETKAEETSPAIEDDKSINEANKTHLASLEKKSAEELEAERETAAERAKRISDQLEKEERYDEWLKNPTILSGIFGKSGMDLAKRIGLGTATLSAIASDVLANYAKGLNGSTDFSNKAVAELNKYVDAVNAKRAEAIAEKAAKPYKTDAENEEKLNQSVTKLKRTSAGLYIPDNALRYLVQNAQLGKPLIEDEKELAIFLNQAEKGFIDSIGKNEKEKDRYVVENDDGTETLTPEGRAVFLDEMETSLSDFGRVLELDETKIANGLKLLETEKKRADIIKDISAARLENTTQFMNAEADIKQRIVEASTLKTKLSEVQDREQSLNLAKQGKDAFGDLNRKTSIDSLTKEERNELFNSEEFSEVKRNLNEELKKHGYALKAGAQLGSEWTVAKISANADWTEEQANTAVREATTNFLNKNSENNVKSNNINNSINKMIDNAINDVYRLYNDSSVEDFKEKREEALNRIDELIRTLEGYNTEIQRIKNDYFNKNPAEKANYENVLNKYNKVEEQPNNNEMLNAFNTYRVPTNNINWYKHKLGLV